MTYKLTIEDMIKMQFDRAVKKGYAKNISFEKNCAVKGKLAEVEKCVVAINATDNSKYHLTNQRVLKEMADERMQKESKVEEIIKYEEIEKYHWITKQSDQKTRLKRSNYDTFIFGKKDGTEVRVDNLGESWLPFSKFLAHYERVGKTIS